jgi:hypothetical protein
VRCKDCNNEQSFIVEGVEVRFVDSDAPEKLVSYFVETKAVCAVCKASGASIELNPLHPDLIPYAEGLGLGDRVP